VIRSANITVRARRRETLADVSFAVDAGECVALLGSNGSGKSLVIQALATATRIAAGSAQVGGVDVSRKPREARKRIGYVAETPLFPDQTAVATYMKALAASHRLPRENRGEAIAQSLDLTDVGHLTDALLTDLSRGEAQRVEFARALLHDPPVLLLDEPLAGLDVAGQAEMAEILTELRAMGKAILLATNLPELLEDVIDRAVILHKGRVVGIGTTAELCVGMDDTEPSWRAAVLRHIRGDADNDAPADDGQAR
jgi:ABC-2 type transport system ATP-binding protein